MFFQEGRVRGTLFIPSGPGPHPTVINLYGGIHKGNVIEDKSAMFASRGIASLSLAFFGVPGLPKTYAL
jgi:dienelactone hydrolase